MISFRKSDNVNLCSIVMDVMDVLQLHTIYAQIQLHFDLIPAYFKLYKWVNIQFRRVYYERNIRNEENTHARHHHVFFAKAKIKTKSEYKENCVQRERNAQTYRVDE